MRSGAARILDNSRVLDADPRQHALLLTTEGVKAQAGSDEAWQTVIDCMSRLVFRIAETYFWKWHTHLGAHASFDDVFMAGLEGLTIGVNKFDENKGTVLTTSTTFWIRTKVQRACYAQCGATKIPEHLLQAGIDPASPLIASSTKSLDYRLDDGDGPALHEAVASQYGVEAVLHEVDGVRRIMELLREVDDRLPQVAEFLERGYADREIARLTGLTSKRIVELREAAQHALREAGVA